MDDIPPTAVVDKLIDVASKFEEDGTTGFSKALDLTRKYLKAGDDRGALDLGNDVTALNSVPLAIYCALRSEMSEDEHMKAISSNEFSRTLHLAYSYGGDTDTIGSMAGAITGARVGESGIPEGLKIICEGLEDARRQADELYDLVTKRKE